MIRRPALSTRSPRAIAPAAAAATAIGLTGCSELSPQATTLSYDAADGVSAEVAGVTLEDVMLIAPENGSTAKLSGLANNPTGGAIELTVGTSTKGGKQFTVPARSKVRLDGKKAGDSSASIKAIDISGLTKPAGDTTTLMFSSRTGGVVDVIVPILLDQSPYGDATVEHPHAEGGEEGGH